MNCIGKKFFANYIPTDHGEKNHGQKNIGQKKKLIAMKKTYRYASILAFLTALILIPVISFYPASAQVSVDSSSDSDSSAVQLITTENPTEPDGPQSAISYSPDGRGYLKSIGNGKNLLHVEGSAYQMGYQHGYLLAEGVAEMASYETFKQIILGFVGLDLDEARDLLEDYITKGIVKDLLGWLISSSTVDWLFNTLDDILDILIEIIKIIISFNDGYVPSEYITEMQGIADGATDAGHPVDWEQILLLNMGFDAILSFVYPVVTPIIALLELFGFTMCDGFVARDDATTDGRTLMGRNFMFNPVGFKDLGLLIEQDPNSGYKFVSVAAPAFVGVVAAMNEKGIGVGIDMVPAIDCTPGSFGMGVLLTAREIAQYANEWTTARNIVKYSKRGVSWLYLIGDGRSYKKGGVVLEVSAHYFYERRIDYKKPWYVPNLWYSQIEKKNDLLVLSNHYIRPEMNFLSGSYGIQDSRWRYETLTALLLNAYGNIDVSKGRDFVDYLHPPNYGYYGSDTSQPVGASRTLFDLTNLKLWSLYGYYDDAWAYYAL